MDLRREFLSMIGAVILINLCLAFGSVGLLARMGPAIAHILAENVYSIVASEEILAELADAGDSPLSVEQGARVRRFVDEARSNISHADEEALLDQLEHLLPAVVEGNVDARRESIAVVRRLVHINRDAMHRADDEARRLGRAGAWAAVLVGLLSFSLSLFVVVRLQRRFLQPLGELHAVLESARHGDRFRRCSVMDAPHEVTQVLHSTNQLLDERLGAGRKRVPGDDEPVRPFARDESA